MANQRSFGQRAAPPVQSYNQRQPVEQQRTSSPVRVKQENLDQAYLDDGEEAKNDGVFVILTLGCKVKAGVNFRS